MEYQASDLLVIFEKAKKYDNLIFLKESDSVHCSFCHKRQEDVNILIASQTSFICNECVEVSSEIVKQRKGE